jgi:hypothetical protein
LWPESAVHQSLQAKLRVGVFSLGVGVAEHRSDMWMKRSLFESFTQ